ncbi:putative ATP-dependent RNA helicase DDX41 [Silurus asotus]|uniref:ATP-dependent RNA helicase DDX41 n=1 Tax=Silurus asotus TaxID=30991 RepID=A0AAD5FP94_SILAS|nr:putative ATP-dependent RNA helicase DDX41 [Silurus asotus]
MVYGICSELFVLFYISDTIQRNYAEEKSASEASEDEDYVPYVPVKVRKQHLLQKMLRLRGKGLIEEDQKDSGGEQRDEDEGLGPRSNVSLLDQHQHLKEKAEARKESAKEKQLKEEEKILESVAEGRGGFSFILFINTVDYFTVCLFVLNWVGL